MRVLVTRPAEDAGPLAARIQAAGHEAVIEPLLHIRFRALAPGDAEGIEEAQALLFTSANGVRAFTRAAGRRDKRVFAVGRATGDAARGLGFTDAAEASGDVASLAALIAASLSPDEGPLLHVAGTALAGDLAGDLGTRGFTVRRLVLYEAETAAALSPATRDLIASGGIGAVMIFSPRTARTFVRLVAAAGLADRLRQTVALCLSEAVAEAARPLPWARLRLAARREEEALLELLAETGPAAGGHEAAKPAGERRMAHEPDGEEVRTTAELVDAERIGASEGAEEGAAPPRRRLAGWARAGLVFLLLAVLGFGLYAAWPLIWGRPDAGGPIAARLAAAEDRLAALESGLARLGERASAAESAAADLAARLAAMEGTAAGEGDEAMAAARLDVIESRLAAVASLAEEAAAASAGDTPSRVAVSDPALAVTAAQLGEAVRDLRERLSAVETEMSRASPIDPRLLLALEDLKAAVERSGPYRRELADFRRLAREARGDGDGPAGEALSRLELWSDLGIASEGALNARFPAMAREALRVSREPGEDATWLEEGWDRVSDLVTIRRTGEIEGETVEAVLARAEARLDAGALGAAVDELETLTGPAHEAAGGWLREARARLTAREDLRRLTSLVAAGQAARTAPSQANERGG